MRILSVAAERNNRAKVCFVGAQTHFLASIAEGLLASGEQPE